MLPIGPGHSTVWSSPLLVIEDDSLSSTSDTTGTGQSADNIVPGNIGDDSQDISYTVFQPTTAARETAAATPVYCRKITNAMATATLRGRFPSQCPSIAEATAAMQSAYGGRFSPVYIGALVKLVYNVAQPKFLRPESVEASKDIVSFAKAQGEFSMRDALLAVRKELQGDRAAIHRTLSALVKQGLLAVRKIPRPGGVSNRYRFVGTANDTQLHPRERKAAVSDAIHVLWNTWKAEFPDTIPSTTKLFAYGKQKSLRVDVSDRALRAHVEAATSLTRRPLDGRATQPAPGKRKATLQLSEKVQDFVVRHVSEFQYDGPVPVGQTCEQLFKAQLDLKDGTSKIDCRSIPYFSDGLKDMVRQGKLVKKGSRYTLPGVNPIVVRGIGSAQHDDEAETIQNQVGATLFIPRIDLPTGKRLTTNQLVQYESIPYGAVRRRLPERGESLRATDKILLKRQDGKQQVYTNADEAFPAACQFLQEDIPAGDKITLLMLQEHLHLGFDARTLMNRLIAVKLVEKHGKVYRRAFDPDEPNAQTPGRQSPGISLGSLLRNPKPITHQQALGRYVQQLQRLAQADGRIDISIASHHNLLSKIKERIAALRGVSPLSISHALNKLKSLNVRLEDITFSSRTRNNLWSPRGASVPDRIESDTDTDSDSHGEDIEALDDGRDAAAPSPRRMRPPASATDVTTGTPPAGEHAGRVEGFLAEFQRAQDRQGAPGVSGRDFQDFDDLPATVQDVYRDQRLALQQEQATAAYDHDRLKAMGRRHGLRVVFNNGAGTKSCLIISLLQHALQDYGSEHFEYAMGIRRQLEDEGLLDLGEPMHATGPAGLRALELANAHPRSRGPLEVTVVGDVGGFLIADRMASAAAQTTQQAPVRQVLIFDAGGHYEAFGPQ